MRGMGRTLILGILLIPTVAATSDYGYTQLPDKIVVNRGGEIDYLPQRKIVTRLFKFISKYTDCHQPMLLAELLAETDHPKELAGIYVAEGSHNGDKTGPCGEVGPFQFMPNYVPEEYDPTDWRLNVDIANDILNEKIGDGKGHTPLGVQLYNGGKGNPKAIAYRNKVMKYVREI